MDADRKPKSPFSYSNLFNLESLMNFQLPQQDDDFDYYGNSSQDESRGSQVGAMENRSNGVMSKKELSLAKKKRWNVYSSEDEEESSFGGHITEERYRAMVGEHIQKYKRRLTNSSASPASTRIGMPIMKSSSKGRKLGTEL